MYMASSGTVELVDAALVSYKHPELKWLIRQHMVAVLNELPSLSPSVDTYTSDDGMSIVLLNVQGLLTVPSSASPPLRLTIWLPKGYPYEAPVVYVFPVQAYVSLAPDHPFVDHRTGRVLRTLPCLDKWGVPCSSLTQLMRSLINSFRICHPFIHNTAGSKTFKELVARLDIEMAMFRGRVDDDIDQMSSLHHRLRTRGSAIDRAVRELGAERMKLEHAVTACRGHCHALLSWLQLMNNGSLADADDGTTVAVEMRGEQSRLWVESKASEIAIDDTMDALGDALEEGVVAFKEYMKRVRILAREQFFHCYRQKQLS